MLNYRSWSVVYSTTQVSKSAPLGDLGRLNETNTLVPPWGDDLFLSMRLTVVSRRAVGSRSCGCTVSDTMTLFRKLLLIQRYLVAIAIDWRIVDENNLL